MYVLQLNPSHERAPQFGVSWAGYWSGLGYVEDPKKAVRFATKKDALRAMAGNFVGLNGLMKAVKA